MANNETESLFSNPFQIASDEEGRVSDSDFLYQLQDTALQNSTAAGNEAGTNSSNVSTSNADPSRSFIPPGNSAGQITTTQKLINTINRITSNTPGRRLLHLVLPNHISVAYEPANAYRGQVVGNGLQNDGVFSNMMAKPTVSNEDPSNDIPPTYEEASADATPPYWDASVFLPYDDVLVDGLPVGNIINFIWNLMVSSAFLFIGFLLTYLLHTSHAAKEGSRAGLGVTFISYGYYMIPENSLLNPFQSNKNNEDSQQNFPDGMFEPADPNNFEIDSSKYLEGSVGDFHSSLNGVVLDDFDSQNKDNVNNNTFDENSAPILAYCIVAFGVFMIVKSLIDYQRAKQMEKTILQRPDMEEV